ncbi:OLC1v1039237C1 [Oldenlandia corymbosa var. corymbosa]|uniref:OLC1v1039237C1 n=1 Tax=Oldenlandia corymbosa var. corymbosa TaxID=529605 RepID=A0AAV1D2N3_OLDCO|nr:OLC1v1039237C1 [Oldenlandia corymbosa var. corymbosa]
MATREQSQEALVQDEVESEDEEEEEGGDGEEDEVEKLEAQVNEMAQKLLNYRATFPDQLKSTLSSVLVARRPLIPTHFDSGSESEPGTSDDPNQDVVRPIGTGNEASAGNEQENEKIKLLKQKITSNTTTIPVVLKRMKDCMKRIDDLDSDNGITIHPVFKRKRKTDLLLQ